MKNTKQSFQEVKSKKSSLSFSDQMQKKIKGGGTNIQSSSSGDLIMTENVDW